MIKDMLTERISIDEISDDSAMGYDAAPRADAKREDGMNRKRKEYLDELAEDMDIPRAVVYTLAEMLGPNEDYDGLVTMLEDYEAETYYGLVESM